MCEVSNQFRLCSCKTNAIRLKHYWILKRPNGGNKFILGEIVPPAFTDEDLNRLNVQKLLSLLNSGNCFDIEMNVCEDDILNLHFSCMSSYLVYAFKYKNGKWVETDWDAFSNNLDDVGSGKVSHALKRNYKLH